MTTNQMIAEVGQVQWTSLYLWAVSLEFVGDPIQSSAHFFRNKCWYRLDPTRHDTMLDYSGSIVIPQLLAASVEDVYEHTCVGYPLDSAKWPDSIWVLLDAILGESRDPLLTAVCESILKTRMQGVQ